MKTKAAVDHYGLLTIPVIPAGLTCGEQVEVVLASRGDEAAPLLLLRRQGLKLPYHCTLCRRRIRWMRRMNQRMRTA
jgi:hypothetical protein